MKIASQSKPVCVWSAGAPVESSEGAWGSPGQPTLWSPTSEASFTDFTKLSFMIEMKLEDGNFPGHPVVKTSPSSAGGVSLIPGWEAKIPHALWLKNQKVKTEAVL